ncbi:hypothetical protein [Nocardia sp. XZ_19_385]|uniref:hypothetical protein n=1 Tax=Nocardia sp. XZ_19_385 TaxID=2769488 RepID=UPI001E2D09AD|nr:hypothetical protein [Nocardia sp. XZ_19_385]
MDTVVVALPVPVRDSRPEPTVPSLPTAGRNARPVIIAAVCLILGQLTIRGWVAGSGYFYWDDLILAGRVASYPLWSAELLLYDHDGHFMPLAFATAWLLTEIAPLAWAGPVASLLVLQLAASMAVLRMLVVLVGARRMILVPLVFYLFCPLTLPAFAWWSAALNALPLQIALAWVIGDAVLLGRGARRRHIVSALLVFVAALLFFEKAVIIPPVAVAVAALANYVAEGRVGWREVWRRGAGLWAGSAVVLVFWAIGYLAVVDVSVPQHSVGELRELLPHVTSLGFVPALFGGPWIWERWVPSTPWADPPGWAVAAAWVTLGAVAALSIRGRYRVWAVWLTTASYVLVAQLPVALARSGPNTAGEIMQSLRYFADIGVILAAAAALVLSARPRHGVRAFRAGPRTTAAVLSLFLVSSLCTTYTFVRSWRTGPTHTYLTNVKTALAEHDGAPLLEQELPWDVLNPLVYPQNLASRALAAVAPAGTFAQSTPQLRMITDSGTIVDASVWWNRSILPGPEPDCGYRIRGADPVPLLLDGPMLEHEWTAQLNYLANRDGWITLAFEHGRPVSAPVRQGLNTVFVRVIGSGQRLKIATHTTGLALCVGVGPVGVASYDN